MMESLLFKYTRELEKTVAFNGAENLTKPDISKAIQEREEKRNSKEIAVREERQRVWMRGARVSARKQPGHER